MSNRDPEEAPGGAYRASLVKRRRAKPERAARVTRASTREATAPKRDLDAELRRETRARIEAERAAILKADAATRAWNEELASAVPALGSVVSRAVATIVGEAPREEVIVAALRRELARVRGEHRPLLRVPAGSDADWIERLETRGREGRTSFQVRRDEGLASDKCVLELGARRVDLTPETQLAAFDDRLRSGVGGVASRPAPPLPEIEPLPVEDEPATAEASRTASEKGSEPRRARAANGRNVKVTKGGKRARVAPPSTSGDGEKAVPQPDGTKTDQPVPKEAAKVEGASAPARTDVGPAKVVPAEPEVQKRATLGPKGTGDTQPSQPSQREPLDDFDALDLGEGAARFEGATPPAPELPGRVWSRGTEASLADPDARGSRAVAALRARVAAEADALRRGVPGSDAAEPTWTGEDGAEASPAPGAGSGNDPFPPFVRGGRGQSRPDREGEANEPAIAPEPVVAPAPTGASSEVGELPGESIRRAIRRGPVSALEPAKVAAPEPTPERPAREPSGSLRLPPRIAKLIAEGRGR